MVCRGRWRVFLVVSVGAVTPSQALRRGERRLAFANATNWQGRAAKGGQINLSATFLEKAGGPNLMPVSMADAIDLDGRWLLRSPLTLSIHFHIPTA